VNVYFFFFRGPVPEVPPRFLAGLAGARFAVFLAAFFVDFFVAFLILTEYHTMKVDESVFVRRIGVHENNALQ
jgi:hypothetical protein